MLTLVPHMHVLLLETLLINFDILDHISRSQVNFLYEVLHATMFALLSRLGNSLNPGCRAKSHDPIAGFGRHAFLCLERSIRLERLGESIGRKRCFEFHVFVRDFAVSALINWIIFQQVVAAI